MNQIRIIRAAFFFLALLSLQSMGSAQIDCPDTMYADGDGCDWVFEIGSFQEGEAVIWSFGDLATEEGGHFNTFSFPESGTYIVCAVFYSDFCPDGVDICTEVVVEGCQESEGCEEVSMLLDDDTADGFVIVDILGVEESANWVLTLNGAVIAENVDSVSLVASDLDDSWELCLHYFSEDCPDGLVICSGPGANAEGCPEEIWIGGEGCEFISSVCNYTPGELVLWTYSDGAEATGHFNWHTFETNGIYEVCATYTSPACLDGVTLCEEIIVEDCASDSLECGLDFIVEWTPIDGGGFYNGYSVTATGFSNDALLNWIVNGEPAQAGGLNPNILLLSGDDFPYVVCAWYSTEECNDVEGCVTIEGGDGCLPGDLLVDTDGCSAIFTFNTPVDVAIDWMFWDFGDESYSDNADFIQDYVYEGNGNYNAQVTVGVGNCVEVFYADVVIEGCEAETDCESVQLTLEWSSDLIVPDLLNWELQGPDVFYDGTVELDGENYWSVWDTLCLAEGCYTFILESDDFEFGAEDLFMGAFSFEDESWIEFTTSFDFGTYVVYEFMVGETECDSTCELEVIFESLGEGMWYFEAVTNDEDAEFVWTFTNGDTYSDNPLTIDLNDAIAVGGCVVATFPQCDGLELLNCFDSVEENECEGVLIELDLGVLNMGGGMFIDELGWLLIGDLFDIAGIWDLYISEIGVIELCVPVGCYEFALDIDEDLVAMLPPSVLEVLELSWEIEGEEFSTTLSVEDNVISAVVSVMADCTDGVSDFADVDVSNFTVYPNPASDRLVISASQPGSWTIMDLHGRIVRHGEVLHAGLQEVGIGDLSAGLYVMRMGQLGQTKSVRLTIAR